MSVEKNLVVRILGSIDPSLAASYEWVAGKVSDLAERAALGGAFAETEAALTSLTSKWSQSTDQVLRELDKVTDGQMNITKLSEEMTRSLTMGFSPQQTSVIWEFANKYADAVGGSMEEVARKIETSISKGRVTALAEFGIMATSGTDAMQKIIDKLDDFGPAVFNFGDVWKMAQNTVSDFGMVANKILNDMAGDSGIEGLSQEFRDFFWTVKEDSKAVAVVVESVFDAAFGAICRTVYQVTGAISDGLFDVNDDAKVVVRTISGLIVGMVYDIEALALGAINFLSKPVTWLVDKMAALQEYTTGMMSPEYGRFLANFRKELADWDNVQEIVLGRKNEALANLGKAMDAADVAAARHTRTMAEQRDMDLASITTVKDMTTANKEAEKQYKENQKSIEKWTDKVQDAYGKMSDALEKFELKQEDIGIKTKRKIEDLVADYNNSLAKLNQDYRKDFYEADDWKERDKLRLKMNQEIAELNRQFAINKAKIELEQKRAVEDARRDYERQKSAAQEQLTSAQQRLEAVKNGATTGQDSRANVTNTGGVAGFGVPDKYVKEAAKSGSPSIILQAPRGDKIGEAIAEWLNKAAMAEGTLRAGM